MNTTTTRRAWVVGGSIVAALALVFGVFQVVNVLARERTTEVQAFPASGVRLLDVSSPNGTVEVLGGDVDEITVTARISHGLRRTSHRAAVEGNVVRVRSSCPVLSTWCGVEYRITVPGDVAVAADVSNGRLIVRDVAGGVRADATNGAVELARLSGDLDVSTDNGRVESTGLRSDRVVARTANGRVRLEFSESPTAVEARSANGRVDVVLPNTTDAYRVDLDTDNGSTDAGVRTDPSSGRSVVARTNNGDVTVRYATG
ncbi:MAG TPA: DUF4097 family beta strand repeat-containing protein [Acidimicrobiales bacterium]|nr:DUF4097 family beta strand repeat-containing protein [Acidimicrobiales bacterium]